MAVLPNYQTFRQRFSVSGTVDPITGYEEWPVAYVRTAGFDELGYPRPIKTPTFSISCNPETAGAQVGANDAVVGVDEYDWYVSQRTDDPALQYLTVTQYAAAKSGTIQFGITAEVEKLLPGVLSNSYLSEVQLYTLYRNVWIYAKRKSDSAVQLIELLPATMRHHGGTGL